MSKIKSLVNSLEPLSPREKLFKILNEMFILSKEQNIKLVDFLNMVEKSNTKNSFDYSFLRENSIVFLLEVMRDDDLTILQDVNVILSYLKENEVNIWKETSKEFIELPIYQVKNFNSYEEELLTFFNVEKLKLKYSIFDLENFILGNSFVRKIKFLKLFIYSYLKKEDWKKEYTKSFLDEQACGNFNFFLKSWLNEIIIKQTSLYLIEEKKDIKLNETINFYLEIYLFAESKIYIDSIKKEIKNELHWIANEISKENGFIKVQEKVVSIVNKYKIAYQEYVLNK